MTRSKQNQQPEQTADQRQAELPALKLRRVDLELALTDSPIYRGRIVGPPGKVVVQLEVSDGSTLCYTADQLAALAGCLDQLAATARELDQRSELCPGAITGALIAGTVGIGNHGLAQPVAPGRVEDPHGWCAAGNQGAPLARDRCADCVGCGELVGAAVAAARSERKIMAIKALRQHCRLGLKEAKEQVEAWNQAWKLRWE